MKKTILCAVLAAVMLTLAGCGTEKTEAPELLTPVGASLDRTEAQVGDLEDISVYAASVAPRYTELCFTSDTVIGGINVALGGEVHAGDEIITMDVSQVQREIDALDSEAAQLSDEADFARQLYEIDVELYQLNMEKASTEDERYDIETEMLLYQLEYENASATRDERLEAIAESRAALENQLEGGAIIAPSDGRVAYLGCAPGQTVGAYDAVCVVTDENSLTIQSDFVSQGDIADAVEIYALVGGEKYALEAEPMDEADYARSVLRGGEYLSVFTVSDAQGLSIGQSAVVCVVNMRKTGVLKVPVNSVFEEDGESYVYIVDGESRVRRDVTVGVSSASEVEILSGLEEGEIVYVGD